jgi:hypothetical protein
MKLRLPTFVASMLLGAVAGAAEDRAAQTRDLEPAVQTSPTPTPTPTPAAPTPPASPTSDAPARARPAPSQAAPAAPVQSRARDRVDLEATQITGNRELPRVMYVVPWKRPDLGDGSGRPANSLLDEVLAPVDRAVFRRENRYYEALRPDAPRSPGQ